MLILIRFNRLYFTDIQASGGPCYLTPAMDMIQRYQAAPPNANNLSPSPITQPHLSRPANSIFEAIGAASSITSHQTGQAGPVLQPKPQLTSNLNPAPPRHQAAASANMPPQPARRAEPPSPPFSEAMRDRQARGKEPESDEFECVPPPNPHPYNPPNPNPPNPAPPLLVSSTGPSTFSPTAHFVKGHVISGG